jgi:hypothetical protein
MKTIVKLGFILSMLCCLSAFGQQGKGPLGQDNIPNTRRELKRDRNVHNASTQVAKDNEHVARKKHKLGVRLYHKAPKRRAPKESSVAVSKKD